VIENFFQENASFPLDIMFIMNIILITSIERGGEYMTQYIINFPDDLHKEAKVRAAQESITLKELIVKAVTNYLKHSSLCNAFGHLICCCYGSLGHFIRG